MFHTGPTHERLEFRVLRFAFLGTSRKSELPGTEPSRGGSTPTEFPFPDSVVPDFVFRIRILRTEGTYCQISQYLFMDSFERQKSQVSDSEVPGSRTTTSASTAQPGVVTVRTLIPKMMTLIASGISESIPKHSMQPMRLAAISYICLFARVV